ncbi:unnamed protein product [Mytilus coruscus]|uniref:SEA domain-containing protein n=1 Tax=Mytilus coruscus TaxID=42192 RepID=A0A6J8C8X6_MYTCO|nr:unnamed protein product [Mytilus coruscus]
MLLVESLHGEFCQNAPPSNHALTILKAEIRPTVTVRTHTDVRLIKRNQRRSQHGDNRSSYFSADLGRSGVYDSVNGTPINFSQRGDNPNDLRNTEGISETARESGLYASRIGSIKQPIEDYSKETIGSTDNFHRQNWDQSFEEGNRTPESGTYSRNIESHQRGGMDYKENDDITRSSTFDNTRDSGLYSRKIGSFRETIPDKDVATPFPDNPGLDNQRQSSKIFKPNKYTGNTLETMLEGEDESKQPEHSTFFSESRKISDTRRNTDYDGHSNASFQDDKEIPTWTDMMFDRQFTDEYIKKKWPKITLPLANTRKNDPFVPGIVDEGSITIDEKSGTHDHKVRNTLCVIGLGTLLLCLVGAAIITIALLADQRTVKVNMTVAINRTFTAELNDTESTEYKAFTTEFCSEMKNVYASKSSSVDGYFGCKVIQLTDGSIIVNYVIYFISSTNQQVTTDTVSTTLITHLSVSSTKLGSLVVITNTIIVHDVATETLESPPAVDKIATTTTIKSTIETTTKENVPSTETAPASESVQQTEATTLKTMQSTTETTSRTISSTNETTPNSKQSTTAIFTPFISSTKETTPKTMQSTTDPSTPSTTSTGDTSSKTMQSTTETTTPLITSTGETTPKTVQSTTETTSPSISSTGEKTPNNMQSTTETTTLSLSSTEKKTQKTMQSSTETITPSIPSTKETTPKSMQSKTSTPSISSTEKITKKTMQSTKETTISSISTTLEPMSSPSNDQVSEETTTQQTFKTTESTLTTTEESTQTETSTTQENISNKDTTITIVNTTPVIVTSPSIASTLKETSTLATTYQTPEMTTSAVTTKPTDESTMSGATMLNGKTTTTSITQSTTKPVTVSDYVTPTIIDVTTRTTHIPFLSETISPVSSAKTEIQSTFTQNIKNTPFFALTDQTNASVKVSTMEKTTSRSTTLSEGMTSTTSEDETTVSTSRIDTSSDKTSSVKITTPEVPSSKETTATLDNVPTTTPAYGPSSNGTSTSLTPASVELNCTDAVEADLYSGPVTMECTVKKSEEFEYIGIYYGNGFDNTIYGVLVYKNGTIFKTYKEHQDISINIESTSTIKLMITFINVTCTMDGSYKVALISNISGEMDEIIGRNVLLKIRSPAGKPTITLNADQVIDLVFPDGNYYRSSGTHTCEGLIGEPPAKLEIDITYDNGTSFHQISNSSIDLSRTNISDECRTRETLSFGLKFSSDMDGARLRCRVSDSNNDFTLSDELSLIPRNICNCGVSESYRGHPNNCKVTVHCKVEGGFAYPTGIDCATNQCRNSITGVCSDDCSDTVCNETVPSDFCTTPAPPTTTPAPSPYIVCTDTVALLNSGPAVITCYLNDTATFTVMNVTYMKSGESSVQQIASIDDSNIITMFAMADIVYISLMNNIINITISNTSCENEGTFAVVTDINGESVMDQGKLSVIRPAGKPALTLNADQVIDLVFPDGNYYRGSRTHKCEGLIGKPPARLEIDITYDNGTSFQQIPNSSIDLSRNYSSNECSTIETVSFGAKFSTDMDGARLRCRVSDSFNDFTLSDELSLIPRNICNCGVSGSFRGHPNNCKVQVYCLAEGGIAYPTGIACTTNQCRNSITGVCSDDCSDTVCNETVPSDFCTTPAPPTTTPAPSPYISCSDASVLINSGAAVMTCSLNDTATFTMINVTYRKKGDSDVQQIAMIGANNNIVMLAMQDSVIISIFDYIINITILNPSCENEGTFGIVTNINSESVEDQGTLTVQYPPEKPVLKLSVDQVVDLGFYRDTNLCTGIIGNPPRELILEIVYVNTTEYKEIPGSILQDLRRNKTISECQNYEQIEFGLSFSPEMQDSKIRCRSSENVNNDTIAEESLILIPRDICSCGDPGIYRGHPGRCDVQVLCISADMKMYPWGRACLDGQCRNSLTGTCSTDCSDAVCNEDVPADFCTTTTIPTTTPVPPKPSVDVSCNGSSIAVNTGPVNVVCYFNETLYEYINITFIMQNETIPRPVANIEASGNVVMIDQTSNRVIEIDVNVIKIKTLIASCDSGGTYGVTVDTGGTPGFDHGILEILTKPDKPSIDQHLHIVEGKNVKYTCTGNVGNPPGYIEFLVRKNGEENFTVSSIESTSSEVTRNDNCNNEQAFYHEHTITSDWNMTTIKCRAVNQRTITENDDMNSYISEEEDIITIPADYCSSPGNTYRFHPRGCDYYVWCVSSAIYALRCSESTCFASVNSTPCVLCTMAPHPCDAT